MMDRDFLKLLPSLATSAASSHSPLPQTEIQVPVLKAKLASNQIIESMVLRSEPRVDTDSKNGQFRYRLDLQTSAGILKLVADQNFQSGSVLLLKFDLQGNPEVVIPDTPALKTAQLKAAVQQLLIQNLPLVDSKPQWIGNIETILKDLPQGVLPDKTLSLLNTLVNYKVPSSQNLHQWVSLDFLKATTRAELITSARDIHNTIKLMPSAPLVESNLNVASREQTLAPQSSPDANKSSIVQQSSQSKTDIQLKSELINPLLANSGTRKESIATTSNASTIQSEKPSSNTLNQQARTFDRSALIREVLSNYARHYHNTSQGQTLPKSLQAVVNSEALSVNPQNTGQPAQAVSSTQKTEQVPANVKEMFSQKVINLLTLSATGKSDAQNSNTKANSTADVSATNMASSLKSRLSEAFVSQNQDKQHPLPLNILMYLIQTELGANLANRPDSVALQLQAKATRILAENQNTYSPGKLVAKGLPIGPRVTAETRMLDSILADIRTGIARSHVHILNQLNNQLLPETERPLFNQIELPILLPGLTETAILEVRQQDDEHSQRDKNSQKQWHFRFHVDFKPLPPCCMEIFYQPTDKDTGSLTLWFWSKDQTSLQLFSQYQEVLQSALRQKGFDIAACTGKMGLPEKSKNTTSESSNMVDIRT